MLTRLFTLTLIALLSGCAVVEIDPRTLSNLHLQGSVDSDTEVRIPDGSELVIEVRRYGRNGAQMLMADERRQLQGGATLPYAFSFDYPAPRDPATMDELQVTLIARGKPLLASMPQPLKLTEQVVNANDTPLLAAADIPFGRAYQCGDQPLVYGFLGGTARLLARGQVHNLMLAATTAEGKRYVSREDNTTQVYDAPGQLLVGLADTRLPACQPLPAPELAITAAGDDPRWYLHLSSHLLQLEGDDEEDRLAIPGLGSTPFGDNFRFRGADEFAPVTATFTPDLCRIHPEDLPQPYSVAVTTLEDKYRGCGGDTKSLLTGREWRLNQLAGESIYGRSKVTLNFSNDGRLTGYSSCNRYTTSWSVDARSLKVGPLAATKMACRPRLADQEQRLFDVLSSIESYDIDSYGALILRGSNGVLKAYSAPYAQTLKNR